jgi:hypothetical protein
MVVSMVGQGVSVDDRVGRRSVGGCFRCASFTVPETYQDTNE